MNRIITTLAVAIIATLGFNVAPASANYGTQVCWADPADPQLIHQPRAIETDRDDDDLNGMIVRDFPNNATGCASYNGTPLQDWETLYVDSTPLAVEPCASQDEQIAYWRAAYERADAAQMKWMQDYIALGLHVDRANAKIDRQRATIKRQRAAIQKLRAQLLGH